MHRNTWPPQCGHCGEFMSFRQLQRSIEYTPFGSYYDMEPSDPEYFHRKCWRKLGNMKKTIYTISWQGPYDNLKKKLIKK